jgi:hypothetical protein
MRPSVVEGKYVIDAAGNLDRIYALDRVCTLGAGGVVFLDGYPAQAIVDWNDSVILPLCLIRHLDDDLKLLSRRFEVDAHIPAKHGRVRSIITRTKMVIPVHVTGSLGSRSILYRRQMTQYKPR